MFNPNGPENPGTLCTAPGQVRAFWTTQAGHDTYEIFGGSTPLTDLNAPLNNVIVPAQRPNITTPGSSTLTWPFPGLPLNADYYIRIRPVKFLPFGRAYGNPSQELVSVPILDPVPWETENPTLIINAIRSRLQGTYVDPSLPISGTLPDGRQFDEGNSEIAPAQWTNTRGNIWTQADGTVAAVPLEGPTERRRILVNARSGPFRRITAEKGAWGATGTFFRPSSIGITSSPFGPIYDAAYMYFGALFSAEVNGTRRPGPDFECGIGYHTRGDQSRQWFVYLKESGRRRPYLSRYIQGTPPTSIGVRFKSDLPGSVGAFVVGEFAVPGQSKLFVVPNLASKGMSPEIRRVFSIAQDSEDPVVFNQGYNDATNSFFTGARTDSLLRPLTGNTTFQWEQIGIYDIEESESSFPEKGPIVNWNAPIILSSETGQRINL